MNFYKKSGKSGKSRKNFLFFLSEGIATWGGAGLLPLMPGSMGSLAALPFAWFLWKQNPWFAWGVFLILFVVGVWAAHYYVKATNTEDNQKIVVDEALGIFLTAAVAEHNWWQYILVFVLFRIFDIWKPFPVRWFDDHVGGGLGVVIDDLAAAVYAALVLWGIRIVL